MRSFRLVLMVAVATLSLTVFGTSVSAATAKNFHLDKTCAGDSTEPLGYVCTVQHSNFNWIPAGTKVHYLSQNDAGDIVQAFIEIKNGSTNGECVWSSPVTAVCTFHPGTGRFEQFHLVVDVTANADQSVWYWDGTDWFGGN
jgi:hypothetical protein